MSMSTKSIPPFLCYSDTVKSWYYSAIEIWPGLKWFAVLVRLSLLSPFSTVCLKGFGWRAYVCPSHQAWETVEDSVLFFKRYQLSAPALFPSNFKFVSKCILTRMEKLWILEVFILTSQLPTHFKNLANVSWRKIPVGFLGTLKFPIHFSIRGQLKNMSFSFFTRGPLAGLHLPLTSCPDLATPPHD